MRRYSPPYYSPPRRGYGGRGRSPPRRGYGGYSGRKDQNNGSLLVRNVPLNCRPEDLRVPFERFGPVRDVYLPKDYYSGESRGFAFVQFVDPFDATEAQYHMNGQLFCGREITVVVAAETRKRPEEMRNRSRIRSDVGWQNTVKEDNMLDLADLQEEIIEGGLKLVNGIKQRRRLPELQDMGPSGYGGRRSSYYGRSRSRSVSRSRSPRHPPPSRSRHRSRSYSPALRQRGGYSISPRRRQADSSRSLRDLPPEQDDHLHRRSYSPGFGDADRDHGSKGYHEKPIYDAEGTQVSWRSPGGALRSLSGSRSRSADLSPRHSR